MIKLLLEKMKISYMQLEIFRTRYTIMDMGKISVFSLKYAAIYAYYYVHPHYCSRVIDRFVTQ